MYACRAAAAGIKQLQSRGFRLAPPRTPAAAATEAQAADPHSSWIPPHEPIPSAPQPVQALRVAHAASAARAAHAVLARRRGVLPAVRDPAAGSVHLNRRGEGLVAGALQDACGACLVGSLARVLQPLQLGAHRRAQRVSGGGGGGWHARSHPAHEVLHALPGAHLSHVRVGRDRGRAVELAHDAGDGLQPPQLRHRLRAERVGRVGARATLRPGNEDAQTTQALRLAHVEKGSARRIGVQLARGLSDGRDCGQGRDHRAHADRGRDAVCEEGLKRAQRARCLAKALRVCRAVEREVFGRDHSSERVQPRVARLEAFGTHLVVLGVGLLLLRVELGLRGVELALLVLAQLGRARQLDVAPRLEGVQPAVVANHAR
mmetsp:Transcript_6811/g.17858  ORF Transcript_6811/g.17858 Transcript_6811/m.17858 type:complete len:375 (+) Transcript_6811:30-1154(+)